MEQLVAGPKQLECICWFLQRGNIEPKVNAALVRSAHEEHRPEECYSGSRLGHRGPGGPLKEQFHPKALKASLKCLLALCAVRKNRIEAVKMGAVPAVVEIRPSTDTRGMLQQALKVLELLSSCAEGREAISEHALAIPMLVKLVLRESESATEHAVVILWMACVYAKNCSDVRDSVVSGRGIQETSSALANRLLTEDEAEGRGVAQAPPRRAESKPLQSQKKILSRVTPF